MADCILDGILGTGIKLPLKGNVSQILGLLSTLRGLPPVVAVDCPSGVDCDSGQTAPESLSADLTVCMAAAKQGMLKQPALNLIGELIIADIGLPEKLRAIPANGPDVMDAGSAAKLLPVRPAEGHKGTFGTCMIAAGSVNYCGAVILAARAAYRSGCGLVRAAIPGAIYDALAGRLPEATWLILPHTMGVLNGEAAKVLKDNLARVDCMLLGPGWGCDHETLIFLEDLLGKSGSGNKNRQIGFEIEEQEEGNVALPNLVIDADALKLLARIENWEKKISRPAVLTPHPGEMAVLTGLEIQKIQSDREAIAREYAQRWGQVVVLKGASTIVADHEGKTAIIPVANSALATAGTGDVLAGLITGLICQGMDAFHAAELGVWLHARGGQLAAASLGNEASVIASDVITSIAQAIKEIGSQN